MELHHGKIKLLLIISIKKISSYIVFITLSFQLYLTPQVRYELKHNDSLTFGDVSSVYMIGGDVVCSRFFTGVYVKYRIVLL